ncbi:hypothetical protein SUGI_0602160 [Cryptomeria japonica]|nr:hypothetical protein SUGI_0602160 [Cryptomeria japonica]
MLVESPCLNYSEKLSTVQKWACPSRVRPQYFGSKLSFVVWHSMRQLRGDIGLLPLLALTLEEGVVEGEGEIKIGEEGVVEGEGDEDCGGGSGRGRGGDKEGGQVRERQGTSERTVRRKIDIEWGLKDGVRGRES